MTRRQIMLAVFSVGLSLLVLSCASIIILTLQLPDISQLENISLQRPLRILSQEGLLIDEYGEKHRTPLPMNRIPKSLINAVIATEDQRFYDHHGVDLFGLARAAIQLVRTGHKTQGASTITMQVARNYFLTREKTYTRKLKEVLLALKIESHLSKNKILWLYLNKIFFGYRAYGVGAAAQVYYGCNPEQLSLAQVAMLAGLPKAPSRNNPIHNPNIALKRRAHVLFRMHELGMMTDQDYALSSNAPITARLHRPKRELIAPYAAEMVRKQLYAQYGEYAYTSGMVARTTIRAARQRAANAALLHGLDAYDRRHAYRQSEQNLQSLFGKDVQLWMRALAAIKPHADLQAVAIIKTGRTSLTALTRKGDTITVFNPNQHWANAFSHFISGDVIQVAFNPGDQQWQLAQTPEIEGAIVAINPHTGAIEAISGGGHLDEDGFNRATQAWRQAGSAFKPFIYTSALEHGYSLATRVNDGPIVLSGQDGKITWRPQNHTHQFYGPTPLIRGLTKSLNLVSVRILRDIGVKTVHKQLDRFGLDPKRQPSSLSIVLGSGDVTPLQMATAYSVFANGGYLIKPHILHTQNDLKKSNQPVQQAIDAQVAYLMDFALKETIRSGTGRLALKLGRSDLAGKTGSTNDQKDAWFCGYNNDLVTVVWVGFDQPISTHEYGSQAALPIWIEFMQSALQKIPNHQQTPPPGIIRARINLKTGHPTDASDPDSRLVPFRIGHQPKVFLAQKTAWQAHTLNEVF